MDSLRTLAEETDGRAIVNKNRVGDDLKQMLKDTSAYLLGYTSTEAARDGKFHEIKVTVKRKDLVVHARKGYWAYTNDDIAKASSTPLAGPSMEMATALAGIAVSGAPHPMRTWLGAVRDAKDPTRADVTATWKPIRPPALRRPRSITLS